jgi:periplasmic protein TonB
LSATADISFEAYQTRGESGSVDDPRVRRRPTGSQVGFTASIAIHAIGLVAGSWFVQQSVITPVALVEPLRVTIGAAEPPVQPPIEPRRETPPERVVDPPRAPSRSRAESRAPVATPLPRPELIVPVQPTPPAAPALRSEITASLPEPIRELPPPAPPAPELKPDPQPARDSTPSTPPSAAAAYLNNPRPAYPERARRQGLEGTVTLGVLVTPEGRPGRVEIKQSSGAAALDQAALDAVRHWRFAPARRAGQAVEEWVLVPLVFQIEAP